MAQQKFIDLSEAASQLGIEQEQLNRLREQGELRGYRDGASWKFRVDEIDKLAAEGLQEAGQNVGNDQPLSVDNLFPISKRSESSAEQIGVCQRFNENKQRLRLA